MLFLFSCCLIQEFQTPTPSELPMTFHGLGMIHVYLLEPHTGESLQLQKQNNLWCSFIFKSIHLTMYLRQEAVNICLFVKYNNYQFLHNLKTLELVVYVRFGRHLLFSTNSNEIIHLHNKINKAVHLYISTKGNCMYEKEQK